MAISIDLEFLVYLTWELEHTLFLHQLLIACFIMLQTMLRKMPIKLHFTIEAFADLQLASIFKLLKAQDFS